MHARHLPLLVIPSLARPFSPIQCHDHCHHLHHHFCKMTMNLWQFYEKSLVSLAQHMVAEAVDCDWQHMSSQMSASVWSMPYYHCELVQLPFFKLPGFFSSSLFLHLILFLAHDICRICPCHWCSPMQVWFCVAIAYSRLFSWSPFAYNPRFQQIENNPVTFRCFVLILYVPTFFIHRREFVVSSHR